MCFTLHSLTNGKVAFVLSRVSRSALGVVLPMEGFPTRFSQITSLSCSVPLAKVHHPRLAPPQASISPIHHCTIHRNAADQWDHSFLAHADTQLLYIVWSTSISVSTPKQVIKLLDEVHILVKSGQCQSVRHALIQLKKDRKTIDRFKFIYYLHKTDPEKLTEVRNAYLS